MDGLYGRFDGVQVDWQAGEMGRGYSDINTYDGRGHDQHEHSRARDANRRGNDTFGRNTDVRDDPMSVVQCIPAAFQSVFNFNYFNSLQSECFEEAYHSDRNVVVSAPTGAGKTVVFELAMLNLLKREIDAGGVFKHAAGHFKSVYLCPTKSLAQERVRDWTTRFGRIGVTVEEFTSDTADSDMSAASMDTVDIVVATPERFDTVTRTKAGSKSWFNEVGLVCIDEVHLVGDDRGACLEAIVSRLKLLRQLPEMHRRPLGSLRLVAVSATIPNVNEIGRWLGDGTIVKTYGQEMRPVKISVSVEGFRFRDNDYLFERSLLNHLPGIVRKYYKGRPMLVFCNSRKLTVDAANQLLKDLGPTFFLSSNHADVDRIRGVASGMTTRPLSHLLSCGIGYHNAALDAKDRAIVEREFSARVVGCVCTTSSLALGVNLPANIVVILGTSLYDSGRYVDIDSSSVMQMVGRAGRPGLDNEGVAVIMTKTINVQKYQNISTGNEPVESHLLAHFPEFLNAEISMGSVTSVDESMRWLENSFLYVRIGTNPSRYSLPQAANEQQIRDILTARCRSTIHELNSASMIEMSDENRIVSREAGRLMSKLYINFKTMKSIVEMPDHGSLPDLLRRLCMSQELSSVRLRRSEKKVLNKINASDVSCRHPVTVEGKPGKTKKVQADHEKVQVLMNEALSDSPTGELDSGMRNDVESILSNGRRIAKCMFDYFSSREVQQLAATANSLKLARSCTLRLWDASRHVTRQLGLGIGPKLSKMLVDAGLDSFDSIMKQPTHQLEQIVGRKYPFGSQLHSAIMNLPPRARLNLELDASTSGVLTGGTLHVHAEDAGDGAPTHHRILDSKKSAAYLIVGCPETDELFLCRRVDFANIVLPMDIPFACTATRSAAGQSPPRQRSVVAACMLECWSGLDALVSEPLGQPARGGDQIDGGTMHATPPPSQNQRGRVLIGKDSAGPQQISIQRSIKKAKKAMQTPSDGSPIPYDDSHSEVVHRIDFGSPSMKQQHEGSTTARRHVSSSPSTTLLISRSDVGPKEISMRLASSPTAELDSFIRTKRVNPIRGSNSNDVCGLTSAATTPERVQGHHRILQPLAEGGSPSSAAGDVRAGGDCRAFPGFSKRERQGWAAQENQPKFIRSSPPPHAEKTAVEYCKSDAEYTSIFASLFE